MGKDNVVPFPPGGKGNPTPIYEQVKRKTGIDPDKK